MRIFGRRVLGWVTIYAVALYTSLAGFAPALSFSHHLLDDPFGVICLTGGDDSAGPGGGLSDVEKDAACGQCLPGGIASSFLPPPNGAIAETLNPQLRSILLPASAQPTSGITSNRRLATGPPRRTA
jgi:hypothetical protein